MHNTHDCHEYNSDNTPTERNGAAGNAQKIRHADKNRSSQRERKGANYAQIICKEVKKAFGKDSSKRKKCHANDSESDSDSNNRS